MSALLMKRTASPLKKFLYFCHTSRALQSTSVGANKSNENTEHYDIIIGGGGLVGSALAAALAKNKALSDKRILLLEGAAPFKGFDINAQFSNRVSAINRNTISLFETIGIWDSMVKARVKPVKQMQVWDASSDALIQFQHEHFADDVACIVENDLILDSLYSVLRQMPNVEVRNQSRIDWVQLPRNISDSYSIIGFKDSDEEYTCDLLIGADGANSLVRKEMGVDVFSIDYKSKGVVATLQLSDAADNSVAWQRFLPNGPVAMLPLSDNMSSLVWSTTIKHADELAAMPELDFVNALNEAFLGEYPKNQFVVKAINTMNSIFGRSLQLRQYPPRIIGIVEKSRASFPLSFLHASTYVREGVALIGDAAHRIHPLAGQGVNLGFSDVKFLVETLADGAYAGAKLGDKQYLLKYEQKSLTKNVPILIGVHGLHSLYSTTFSPIVLLRSLGLQLTENIPQIKNIFMKRAIS